LIDLAQAVMGDLRSEVQAAQEDLRHDWLAP
jgi:hypothetical protein